MCHLWGVILNTRVGYDFLDASITTYLLYKVSGGTIHQENEIKYKKQSTSKENSNTFIVASLKDYIYHFQVVAFKRPVVLEDFQMACERLMSPNRGGVGLTGFWESQTQ